MRKDAITSLLAVVVLTVLLGVLYPLAVTGISQVTMKDRADGSVLHRDGRAVGSTLIGQDFRRPAKDPDGSARKDADGEPVLVADPRYFQSRPSVTGYKPNATAFSNRGPNGKDTKEAIDVNVAAYLALERPYDAGLTVARIPVDAVTDSASGVDPHISQANARIQARRVAKVRGLPLHRVLDAVDDHTAGRGLGVLGEPGVNVLELNLALDGLRGTAARAGGTSSSTTTTEGTR
ncbi:potassium-transporting ATPase subunit C [Patulibacter minatonensis]|uniref:potassium-transporting ATPase subunit C n=1 Tax=Patulibacter minatonensis TaxID=298163 RepID=UPI0004B051A2|nr:potassium-transporting ATPase subunit C [Patulibacter minatonensis]